MKKTIFNPFKMEKNKNLFWYFKSLHRDHGCIPTLCKDGIVYSTNAAKADVLKSIASELSPSVTQLFNLHCNKATYLMIGGKL